MNSNFIEILESKFLKEFHGHISFVKINKNF